MLASNPFAPAAPVQAQRQGNTRPGYQNPNNGDAFTGPFLGRGSEMQKVYNMPDNLGHDVGGIFCMLIVDDKVYTGGRDGALFVWRGQTNASGDFELVQDCEAIMMASTVCSLVYEPESKWLFCGLWDGSIQAYCKEPAMTDSLCGHKRSVNSLTVHSSVMISGSHDGTLRLWVRNPQTGRYQQHGDAMRNPSGPVNTVKVFCGSLWAGSVQGITCFDLTTLQAKGTITSQHPVQGLLEFETFMVATYRNGDVKIFDPTGVETFYHPSRGEHTSNTAVALMMHPYANKPMLLCGQVLGYVTAYDLPEFRPRGSWQCKIGSDVRAIADVKHGGMFLTAGLHSDIMVWKWANVGGNCGGAPVVAASPFAPGASSPAVAANPFAVAPGPGMAGEMMMG